MSPNLSSHPALSTATLAWLSKRRKAHLTIAQRKAFGNSRKRLLSPVWEESKCLGSCQIQGPKYMRLKAARSQGLLLEVALPQQDERRRHWAQAVSQLNLLSLCFLPCEMGP